MSSEAGHDLLLVVFFNLFFCSALLFFVIVAVFFWPRGVRLLLFLRLVMGGQTYVVVAVG